MSDGIIYTKVVIVLLVLAGIAWTAFAAYRWGLQATVSRVMWQWGHDHGWFIWATTLSIVVLLLHFWRPLLR